MELWFIISLILVLTSLSFGSFWFVYSYISRESKKSFLSMTIFTLAIIASLLAIFLIPPDVYIHGSSYHSVLRICYYSIYGSLAFFIFAALPFIYFYFEEDAGDEDGSETQRVMRALVYTGGFLIVLVILIVAGFLLKEGGSTDNWKGRLNAKLSNTDRVLQFIIAILALLGLPSFIIYTSFGLAHIPISLMRKDAVEDEPAYITSRNNTHANDDKRSLLLNDNAQSHKEGTVAARLAEKYGYKAKFERKPKADGSSYERQRSGKKTPSRCSVFLSKFFFLRIILGTLLTLMSLFVIIATGITIIYRLKYSTCGIKCGFAIEEEFLTKWNIIDGLLLSTSTAFPVDLIIFSILVVYLLFACFIGMVQIGARICFFKAYNVIPNGTNLNGFAFAIFLLILSSISLTSFIFNIATQYTTFGNQHYYLNDVKKKCTLEMAQLDNKTCLLTNVSTFAYGVQNAAPVIAVIQFFAICLFNLMFFGFAAVKIYKWCNGTVDEVENDDPDSPTYVYKK